MSLIEFSLKKKVGGQSMFFDPNPNSNLAHNKDILKVNF